MKIIFSPSKGQKCSPTTQEVDLGGLIFKAETDQLKNQLKKYSEEELAEILKVSDKISKDVWSLYNKPYLAYPAYELYTGTAYKAIEEKHVLGYQMDNVYILSALYGAIPIRAEITPYRLDFNSKMHLYSFWKEPMKTFFSPDEDILSLASQEFEKMIPKSCNLKKIRFYTKDKEGKLKTSSVEGKTARGTFLNYLLEKNAPITIETILSFEGLGYKFSLEKSKEDEFVFIRNQG